MGFKEHGKLNTVIHRHTGRCRVVMEADSRFAAVDQGIPGRLAGQQEPAEAGTIPPSLSGDMTQATL